MIPLHHMNAVRCVISILTTVFSRIRPSDMCPTRFVQLASSLRERCRTPPILAENLRHKTDLDQQRVLPTGRHWWA